MDKEAVARLVGMDYALRQIEANGIENFRKDLAYRKGKGFSIPMTQAQISKNSKESLKVMTNRVLLLALYALRDEFGFGKTRGMRFFKRFWGYLQSIGDDYVTWYEVEQVICTEMGIDIDSYNKEQNAH